jgi:hypothetical protein
MPERKSRHPCYYSISHTEKRMNYVLTRAIAFGGWVAARLVTLARIYLTLLGGWALAYFLLGDRWWWLFALSSVAICLFAPV